MKLFLDTDAIARSGGICMGVFYLLNAALVKI